MFFFFLPKDLKNKKFEKICTTEILNLFVSQCQYYQIYDMLIWEKKKKKKKEKKFLKNMEK